jgi:hypothetical protein
MLSDGGGFLEASVCGFLMTALVPLAEGRLDRISDRSISPDVDFALELSAGFLLVPPVPLELSAGFLLVPPALLLVPPVAFLLGAPAPVADGRLDRTLPRSRSMSEDWPRPLNLDS